MRLFAALPLPDVVAERLLRLRLRLSDAQDGLRWSMPAQWHITLQFYGDVEEGELGSLEAALQCLRPCSPQITMQELGLFPNKGLLFAAIAPSATLLRLQEQVAQLSAACGFAGPAGRYHPHVTLARSKGKAGDRALKKMINPEPPAFGTPLEWTATECLLLESTLQPTGAEYEVRARLPLCHPKPEGLRTPRS